MTAKGIKKGTLPMTAFLSMINKQFIFALGMTRLAAIALFAGLFILSACGGAPLAVVNVTLAVPPDRPDAPDGPCHADVFSAECGLLGEPARTIALNTCRNTVQKNFFADCEANIPAAAVACFKDPFNEECKTEDYQAVLARSSATPQIDALRIALTENCRDDTIKGDACISAIANTCDPAASASVATGTGDIRALLVTDALCNDETEYNAERAAFLNDCRGADPLKRAGCTDVITACAYVPNAGGDASSVNPFVAECSDAIYDTDRIVYCQAAMADEADDLTPPAGCEIAGVNIVESYCEANIFTATAGCSTNADYADDRIEFCIEGTNARTARCQNKVTFPELAACFENPFGTGCDVLLDNDLTTARLTRETHCRALDDSDLVADALCAGTVINFCEASKFDRLCVADIYIEQRETTCRTTPANDLCADTIAELCTDIFTQTLPATLGDTPVNLCVDTEGSTAYVDARLTACLVNVQADESCAGEDGLIDTFCKADPFNPADGCMAESYDLARQALCLDEPTHGSCGDIIEAFCLADPLTQTTETIPANLCGGAYDAPRESACRKIATAAVGTTAGCVDLVVKTCTFIPAVAGGGGGSGTPASGNPYDTLCDVTVYGDDQAAFCLDPFNSDNSPRCDGMIKTMCDANPFSTDNAGMDICGESYASDRLTRCRNDAAGTQDLPMGVDCTDIIAGVCNNDLFDTLCPDLGREVSCRSALDLRCIPTITRVCEGVVAGNDPVANPAVPAAPFDELCDDNPFYADVSYTNARAMACLDVASGGTTPDTGVSTGGTDRCPDLIVSFCMDNPFNTVNGYCQDDVYNTDRESMCSNGGDAFGTGDCLTTILRICDVGNKIFNSICDTGYRQARIDDCIGENPSNVPACDTAEIYGTICGGDTGNVNTNPFDDVCASATESGAGVTSMSLAMARDAVVTFCNDAIVSNRDRAVCMNTQESITDLNTDCVLVANAFGSGCDYTQYDNNRAAFCGVDGRADSFNPACDTEYAAESLMGRKAFVILCREMPMTEGCATTALDGSVYDSENPLVTIADCVTNPYRAECENHPDFIDEKMARTMLCTDSATFFSPLCNGEIIAGVVAERAAYCITNAGSFNPECNTDHENAAMIKRMQLILLCRGTRDAEGCDTTAIDGSVYDSETSVTVADCITNPYRVECYGTEDARNPYFVDETMARDTLCGDVATFFDPLCDGDVVPGVRAARFARCSAEATTFDTNCDPAIYGSTNRARGLLIDKCRAAADARLLDSCSQVVATMDGPDGFTRTVIDCIDNTVENTIDNGGDPYQSGCFENPLFDGNRATRRAFCIMGDNAGNDAKCTNATMQNLCIKDPFGNDAGGMTCSSITYADARRLRTTYCLEDAGTDDPLCASRKDFICVDAGRGTRLAANPFALLCGDPSMETRAQMVFCMDINNMENDVNCAADDVAGRDVVCPDNPFNDSFGLNDLDCTIDAYLPQRVTQCRDGTQTDTAECDKTGIADVICAATGAEANPFLALCDGAMMAGYDSTNTVESIRTTFANTCASDDVGDLICTSARAALCLATGDYAHPFATACVGEDGIADIQEAYCLADTAWEAVCNTLATTEDEIALQRRTLLTACEGEEATRPPYCSYKVDAAGEDDETIVACLTTPFALFCMDDAIDGLLGGYRADYCQTPATSFHRLCNEAEYRGTDATQRAFAEVCERDRDATGCDGPVNGVNGVTIRECVNNAMGNPYSADCVGLAEFEQQRIGRVLDCAETPDGAGCTSSLAYDFTDFRACFDNINNHLIDPDMVALMSGCDRFLVDASVQRGCDNDPSTAGCTEFTDDNLTVQFCNTNPFLTGCSGDAFIHARRKNCATATSKHADCNVAEGQGYTNYVQGSIAELDLGDSIYKDEDELATYMEDNLETENIDESKSGVRDDLATVLDESRIKIGSTYDATAKVRREGIEQGGLTLSAIGGTGDNLTDSGFAYAYIPGGRGDDGINGWDRYYAGLLSGTDVGTPLVETEGMGQWHGRLAIVNKYGGEVRVETADFVLTVNFANKTLDAVDVAVLDGLFTIDGRFSASGVIYGLTSFRDTTAGGRKTIERDNGTIRQANPPLSSRGSVTGVIGINGAVGAFISSGEGIGNRETGAKNTFGEYAGGFVASPTAPDPADSCLLDANLFREHCIAEDAQHYDVCVTTAEINSARTTEFCKPFVARYIERETECADQVDILNALTKPLCEPVITRVCDGNVFKTDAGTDATKFDCTTITRYDDTRKQVCRNPAYRSTISACGAIIVDICTNDNPFTQTTGRNPTNLCDSSYNMVRETQCAKEIMDSKSDTVVTNQNLISDKCLDIVQTACRVNPFNRGLCYARNGNFTNERLAACIKNPSVDRSLCSNILATSCPTDGSRPRNRECIGEGYRAWEAKFNTAEAPIEASIPDGETQNSRILLGGSRGLDTYTNVANIRIPEIFLRFNSRYTRIDTGETVIRSGRVIPIYDFKENEDYYYGVSFFSATAASGQIGHYAGILTGTRVGAPLTDPRVDVQWHGQFGLIASDSDVPRETDFVLNVDFSTRTISADDVLLFKSITRQHAGSPDPFYIADTFSLTAVWDADTGVFTGTTTFTRVAPIFPDTSDPSAVIDYITLDEMVSTGVLTGIIGVGGAVGVFASDETQTDEDAIHYAGGFFALPAPRGEFNAWVGSFGEFGRMNTDGDVLLAEGDFTRTNRADGTTYFIEGLADGLGLATGGDYEDNNQDDSAEVILRLDETRGADGYSGVAFWSGKIRNDAGDAGDNARAFPTHSYGGLLSDTNVGVLLPRGGQAIPNGVFKLVWTGQISGIFNGIDAGGMIGGTAVDTSADGVTRVGKLLTNTDFTLLIDYTAGRIATLTNQSPFLALRLDGRFDANGVISGDVTGGEADGSISMHGQGRFSGMIGADGVVGVFKSNAGATNSFIGGFTATPTVTRVDTTTWTTSFDETTRMNTAGDVLLAAGDFTEVDRPADSTHFIEAGENGLGLIDGAGAVSNHFAIPEYFLRLDGTTGTSGHSSGVVFWSGFLREDAEDGISTPHRYAGLLSGTQVGLPLPQGAGATFNNAPSATWNGTIRGTFLGTTGIGTIGEGNAGFTRDDDRLMDTGFQLLVNYGARTIKTPVGKEFFGDFKFSLDGTFDGGVMGGTLTPAPINSAPVRPAGRFSGIIGSNGAVGVFKSNNDAIGNNSYIGGFVATPPSSIQTIKAFNWEASFAQASSDANTIGANAAGDVLLAENVFTKTGRPADSSHFIKTGANGLGLRLNDVSPVQNHFLVPEYFLRLDGTTGAIGASAPSSGAVFWAGFIRDNAQDSSVAHLYAGLLPGTDVGLPLPQGAGARHNGAPSVTWNGTIRGIFRGIGPDDSNTGAATTVGLTRFNDHLIDTNFQMLIDFGARTIKTPVGQTVFGNFNFSLDGTFDGGVMAGTITPADAPIADRNAPATGRFSGVIGVDGAVGVFKSDNDGLAINGYIGGFAARPIPPVRFSTWTDSFSGTPSTNTAGDILLAEDDITATNGATLTTHFITGQENGIGLAEYTGAERFLRLDGTTGLSGDSDGLAFWGNVVETDVVHLYAGLLSGTQVGLALPRRAGATFQGKTSAVWKGVIRGLFQGTEAMDFGEDSITRFTKTGDDLLDTRFKLLVNYGTGALTTPAGKTSFGTIEFGLNGSFDTNGVMTGTYTASEGLPAGRFGGIIGTKGAVGVFKSNGAVSSIVGGFVARP